jgi:hypothetical protein
MRKKTLANRFGSIVFIHIQLDLTSNGLIGQIVVLDLLLEVIWKITELVKK